MVRSGDGIAPHYGLFVLTGVFAIIARVVLLSTGMIIAQWADTLCSMQGKCQPMHLYEKLDGSQYLWLFLGAILVGSILTLFFRSFISALAISYLGEKHDSVIAGTSRTSKMEFDRFSVGEILQILAGDYAVVQRFCGGSIGETVTSLLDLLIIAVFFLVFDQLALVPCLIVAVIAWRSYNQERVAIFGHKAKVTAARSGLLQSFNDDLNGKFDISQYNAEGFFNERFHSAFVKWSNARTAAQRVQMLYAWKVGAFNLLALLFVGLSGVFSVQMGWLSIGTMMASLTYALIGISTLCGLLESVPRIEEARCSWVNILSFENRLRKRCDEPLKMRERITTESSVIRLHEVSLVLGQGKNPVLNKISLDLKEGESLGVIGPSGCGKSSLISVMLGIHLPTSGTMYIAPQLIADSVHEYRRKFAVIPQTPLLVSGSLRSNLCDGNSVADEELVDILNQLGVHRLFGERVNAKMLDHMIDGLNPKMSTGDAQMIMATRAFLKKDAVVIMDEPTSMMDPKRERNFHHVIDRVLKDRTQLRVAHRLETIRNCDRLVYMEHGSVVMIDSVERVLSAFSMRT